MTSSKLSGRGARSNVDGRYERYAREAFDDGWTVDDEATAPRTEMFIETARTIIARNDSPDISFDRTINPYRGCEHGCIYCYARPNHAYVGLSPGLDFERKIFAKTNAVERLEAELAAPGYRPDTIVLGGVTDIYQPLERELRITRGLLETLQRRRHPVALITKSQLILRDVDILSSMAADNLAKAAISLTTLDKTLARRMEPRAAAPHRRLAAIEMLAEAGVPVTVMTAPLIPGLNDHEIESLLAAAAEAGATGAGYVVLRLPLEIKDLFAEWLETDYPDRAARVLSLTRSLRGGKDYDARWGVRQRGEGPYAQLIAARFKRACDRLGLNKLSRPLDCTKFRGGHGLQMELF
jgi:DNA repair photolyase